MDESQTFYFDMSLLEHEGRQDFHYVDLLKRAKGDGHPVVILVRGRNLDKSFRWLEEKGLSPFVDIVKEVDPKIPLYTSVDDRTGVLVTKYESDIQEWFSESVKCTQDT